MAAPVGNQFWRLQTKYGKDALFTDGAALWEAAAEYFHWCDTHPWYKPELVKYKGGWDEAETPLGRPYTMDGLTVYLRVSGSYFRSRKSEIRAKIEKGTAKPNEVDVLGAIELIEATVRTQQIEGAALNVFNANLVARLNNLADNVNQSTTGEAVIRVSVRDQKTADDMGKLDELI